MEELPHLGRPIRVIGRYALYGKLAAGGMATVHFGRLLGPAGFSRTVAIKRLHPQFAKDPEFVAMFLDEARLAARIQHPNVVSTVDVVAMGEELFLVMDYIRGESFSRLLRASRKKRIEVPLGIVASVVTGMLHGLHAAHEAKDEQGRPLAVVHRDVSPQNVLVGADGVPRVLDFGVAKAAARIQVTRDGQMKGKLSYMAPEQLKGQGVDRRTDVFAAAIVLWEALTGRRLFDAEEPQEVLRMIVSEDIPPPSAVVPSIPRGVDAVVMKALTRDVSKRYQSAREFAIALEDVTHIASPREVGEWVERVAGDTLQHREQAVAEIEAVSSVSDVSAISGAGPGLTSTLVGQPPPPALAAASEWEEGPTRIYDSSAAVEAGLDKATQVHVPRPPSQTSRRPTLSGMVPPAARAPSRRPPPKPERAQSKPPEPMFPPPDPPPRVSRPPALPPRAGASAAKVPPSGRPSGAPASRAGAPPAPPSSGSAPSKAPPSSGSAPSKAPPPLRSAPMAARAPAAPKSGPPPLKSGPERLPLSVQFDDENEQTIIKDAYAFDDENEKTIVKDTADAAETSAPFFPPEGKAPGWDDEGETTHILDPSGDELIDAAARLMKPRLEIPVPRPAAGAPPSGPSTVVLSEHTSPALLRARPAPWAFAAAWLWGSPAARARRVGVIAGAAGLLVGVALFAARMTRPAAPHVHAVVAEEQSPPPRPSALAETAAPPEPRGIDPAMLPTAEPEGPAPRAGSRPSEPESPRSTAAEPKRGAVAPKVVVLETSPPPPEVKVEPPPPAPPPAPEPPSDDIESPYGRAPKAAAPKPAAPPAAVAEKAKPAPEAPSPKAAAKPAEKAASGCAQPFTIDEHGIKRIKPECL